ncbi:MAG: DinB family protein [Thermomicrobiales bacterium]
MDRSMIEGNAAAQERLRALIARLSDDDLRRDLGDGWTVAAALAHIAFWDRRAAVLLERWARAGLAPSPADADAINDAMLPQWLAIPPRAAAEDALAAAAAVDQRLAALSDDLARSIREQRAQVQLDRSLHRIEHVDEIERLLGR